MATTPTSVKCFVSTCSAVQTTHSAIDKPVQVRRVRGCWFSLFVVSSVSKNTGTVNVSLFCSNVCRVSYNNLSLSFKPFLLFCLCFLHLFSQVLWLNMTDKNLTKVKHLCLYVYLFLSFPLLLFLIFIISSFNKTCLTISVP